MKTLLKNVTQFHSNELVAKDVLIENGKIVEIDSQIDADSTTEVIDGKGKLLSP